MPKHLPPRIPQRLAAGLVVEALGDQDLADYFFRAAETRLNDREHSTLEDLLQRKPEEGGPRVHYDAHLLDAAAARDRTRALVGPRRSRPADLPGAEWDENGHPTQEPTGAIWYSIRLLQGLDLHNDISKDDLPARRPGAGREAGRPSLLDVRAMLRILLRQVERCRPESRATINRSATCALLLWLNLMCRPNRPPPPGGRWPLLEKGDAKPREDLLPNVVEVEELVATGESVTELARWIEKRARARAGEYAEYYGLRRRGS